MSSQQDQTPSTSSSSDTTQKNSVLTLFDFISLVPSPLTVELVSLSSYISYIRHAAEIASWKSSWSESWLALAAWWAICLFSHSALRYFLPLIIILVLAFSRWRPSPRLTLVTEQNLQAIVYDLSTIQGLIPNLPPTPATPFIILIRIIVITYIPYLALTYFIPISVLLGIAGTILITWRAPWATTARHALWSSAYIRWGVYHLSARLTGQPLPPLTLSTQSTPTPITSIRFLFTIYENQRWWMGLDWTAALLPAERPSWCSASQTAVSPPNAFSLPEPAVAFLPDGKGGRVKRTATWRWEEGEWKVLVRKDGVAGVTRVERPLPDEKESPPANRILKAVGMKRDSISASGEKIAMSEQTPEVPVEGEEEEIITDPDGWIYGDNKWEGASAKGGLGKYTRYRRWTRVAVLSETIETVEAGDVGVTWPTQDSKDPAAHSTLSLPPTPSKGEAFPSDSLTQESPKDGNRGLLRQRLKAAVDGSAL